MTCLGYLEILNIDSKERTIIQKFVFKVNHIKYNKTAFLVQQLCFKQCP